VTRAGAGSRPAWRLLVTEPLDGATNMALDEALLRSRIAGAGPPTVRLYAWRPATVSLGYAQPLEATVDRARCAALGVAIVRRPTGGSAILHEPPDRELTYSVVARADDVPGGADVLDTYRLLGGGLVRGLRRLGVPAELAGLGRDRRRPGAPAFCFARTGAYEVVVAGRKLVGSAQRRQRGAFLQHGTVPLAVDPARLRAVFPGEPDPLAAMTTLAAALGRAPAFDAVAAALGEGLAHALGVRLAPAALSRDEIRLVAALAAGKYATDDWTLLGRGPREASPAAAALDVAS
jgi:lipoate-protein ligase A